MEEKILTLRPPGKRGVNISKAKYETMKKTIVEILGKAELTHAELTAAVEKKLEGKFDGSNPLVHGKDEAGPRGSRRD